MGIHKFVANIPSSQNYAFSRALADLTVSTFTLPELHRFVDLQLASPLLFPTALNRLPGLFAIQLL